MAAAAELRRVLAGLVDSVGKNMVPQWTCLSDNGLV